MTEVYVTEVNLFGEYMYLVVVDGKKYDQMFSKSRLTWQDQRDMAKYYREALDGYEGP
jgi:hypothetical protein